MHHSLPLLGSFAAGALLGLAFLWGLWLTVAGLGRARRPALHVLGSFLLRSGLVAGACFTVSRYGGSQHILAGLLGFSIIRFAILHAITPLPVDKEPPR